MGRHEPVIAARVEVFWVSCDLQSLLNLFARAHRPLVHQIAQVEVVVNGIIVELLLAKLLCRVLEGEVEPVDHVQHFNRLLKQFVVYLRALNNVQGENVLELHYYFEKHFRGQCRHEFDRWHVFGQVYDLALLIADVVSENVDDEGEDLLSDTLADIVSKFFIEDHHEETAEAHQLILGVPLTLVVLVSDHVNHVFDGLPVPHLVHLHVPQPVEVELDGGQINRQWLVKLFEVPSNGQSFLTFSI